MNGALHILVVDDHAEIRDLVTRLLSREGFRVTQAGDGRQMFEALEKFRVDLILLDLMLPGEDGLSLIRRLRATSDIPVIIVSAKGEEVDRVIGLELGADDYLAKPFGGRELVARVRAVLRRKPAERAAVKTKQFRFGRWLFDVECRELRTEDGVSQPLSTGEFDLLLAMVERPGHVLSREQLLDLARGRDAVAFDRAIDTQVSRLRRKIEADPADPAIIKTVWGGGYVFAVPVSHA